MVRLGGRLGYNREKGCMMCDKCMYGIKDDGIIWCALHDRNVSADDKCTDFEESEA